jgi:hypothetical protein
MAGLRNGGFRLRIGEKIKTSKGPRIVMPHETYPPHWAKVTLMVSPTGEMHAIAGDRADGDPSTDLPYIGLQRIEERTRDAARLSRVVGAMECMGRRWGTSENVAFLAVSVPLKIFEENGKEAAVRAAFP